MKYEIGQQVWCATWEPTPAYVTCEDCAGTAVNRVILPDETIVSIECEGCKRGYYPATGKIQVYDRKASARADTIIGVTMNGTKAEWRTEHNYSIEDENIFDNEADAKARATVLAAEQDHAERERVLKKEKPLKSWAWHARYHARAIKEAQRQIEHHTAKLAVAKVKAKEPEPSVA